MDTQYTDEVAFDIVVPMDLVGKIKKDFMEASGGKAAIKEIGEGYFAEIDGEIKILS